MKHPKSEKAHALADYFDMAAEVAPKGRVEMGQRSVPLADTAHKCGTVACHAGWFGAFHKTNITTKQAEKILKDEFGQSLFFYEVSDQKRDFSEYVLLMEDFMGVDDLEEWASDYPEIWGNAYGGTMFDSSCSFTGSTKEMPLSIKDIACHWRKVAYRLELYEGLEASFKQVNQVC